jgi:hypothetical protein
VLEKRPKVIMTNKRLAQFQSCVIQYAGHNSKDRTSPNVTKGRTISSGDAINGIRVYRNTMEATVKSNEGSNVDFFNYVTGVEDVK